VVIAKGGQEIGVIGLITPETTVMSPKAIGKLKLIPTWPA